MTDYRSWRLIGRPDGIPEIITVAKTLASDGQMTLQAAHMTINNLAETYSDDTRRQAGLLVFLAPDDEQDLIKNLAALQVDAAPC